VARANASRLGLGVRFLQADLLDGLADEFDALLANLPYVSVGERSTLAPEITRHEPAGALFAGADGLDAIRALTEQLATRPNVRLLALEVGAGQASAVAELCRAAGFEKVGFMPDLAGIERMVKGER
jgi:release factor glutamine methyltransferase